MSGTPTYEALVELYGRLVQASKRTEEHAKETLALATQGQPFMKSLSPDAVDKVFVFRQTIELYYTNYALFSYSFSGWCAQGPDAYVRIQNFLEAVEVILDGLQKASEEARATLIEELSSIIHITIKE